MEAITRADLAASPVVAVLLMVALVLVLAAALYAALPGLTRGPLPTVVLKGRLQHGWVHLDHLAGDPLEAVTVRTVVDGVAWDTGPHDLGVLDILNTSRPAPRTHWAVDLLVLLDDGRLLHQETVRDGEREERPADLVVRLDVDRARGRLEITGRNVGPSPTPAHRQAITYLYVDGEDPSDPDAPVHFPAWLSNRNHTPAPLAPGEAWRRVRTFDPADLPAGPHVVEVVVNINKAGEPNLDEVDYGNNRARVRI